MSWITNSQLHKCPSRAITVCPLMCVSTARQSPEAPSNPLHFGFADTVEWLVSHHDDSGASPFCFFHYRVDVAFCVFFGHRRKSFHRRVNWNVFWKSRSQHKWISLLRFFSSLHHRKYLHISRIVLCTSCCSLCYFENVPLDRANWDLPYASTLANLLERSS